MSDSFHPAAVAPLVPHAAGEPAPNPGVPTEMLHQMAISDEIAAAFRHIADMLPALQPLLGAAARIEAKVAQMRAILQPPPDGPQHDHS